MSTEENEDLKRKIAHLEKKIKRLKEQINDANDILLIIIRGELGINLSEPCEEYSIKWDVE